MSLATTARALWDKVFPPDPTWRLSDEERASGGEAVFDVYGTGYGPRTGTRLHCEMTRCIRPNPTSPRWFSDVELDNGCTLTVVANIDEVREALLSNPEKEQVE